MEPTTADTRSTFGNSQIPNPNGPSNVPNQQGGNSAGPTYHNMSPGAQWSPLSGNQPHDQDRNEWNRTAQSARFGQWAPGAGTEQKPFDAKDWSVEGKKASKELRAFDGNMAHYDNWRIRMRDHFMSTNCNYATIFELVESNQSRLDWMTIANARVQALPNMNWQWIASHIWTVTGTYLSDIRLNRKRISL